MQSPTRNKKAGLEVCSVEFWRTRSRTTQYMLTLDFIKCMLDAKIIALCIISFRQNSLIFRQKLAVDIFGVFYVVGDKVWSWKSCIPYYSIYYSAKQPQFSQVTRQECQQHNLNNKYVKFVWQIFCYILFLWGDIHDMSPCISLIQKYQTMNASWKWRFYSYIYMHIYIYIYISWIYHTKLWKEYWSIWVVYGQ